MDGRDDMPKTDVDILQEKVKKRKKFAERLRLAKSARRLKNHDIVKISEELGIPMSLSTISQSMTGRLTPTKTRLQKWAKILRVNQLWLEGYGQDDQIMNVPTTEEQNKDLEELSRLFLKLNPERQKLILALVKELAVSVEHPIYDMSVVKEIESRMKNYKK